jgi:hypothetical protein
MSATAAKSYGSAEAASEEYDLENTYYVKGRELSSKERLTKCILVLLPILAAVILIGGFAYYVTNHILERNAGGGHKADTAYPESPYSSGGGGPSRPGSYPSTESNSSPAPAPKKSAHSSSTRSSSCSANPKCLELGLKGNCCPTNDGVTLGCCD